MSRNQMRDIDPLLKDLSEKKQSFRRNVASLTAEFREVRSRLALKEQTCATDILTRKEIEDKAKNMTEEITKLQKNLEERNGQLDASNSAAEKYLMELDNLRSQLIFTQATAEASSASAESTKLQCIALLDELNEKSGSLKEHDIRLKRMEEQLESFHKDLKIKEITQKHYEHALTKAGANKERELRKTLDVVFSENLEKMNKLLTSKDEEITRLKDEIKILSAHWRLKTKELESQLEKNRKADQDLKKRVLKLEFCFQEARSQTRKLQRIGERREKGIQELLDEIAAKQHQGTTSESGKKRNVWDSSGFKVLVSMSMLILVVFSKR